MFIGYVQKRREVTVPPTYFDDRANTRDILPIGAQDAPDPVRQSNFSPGPVTYPKAISTNIPGIQAVSLMENGYPLFAPSPHAHYLNGYGGQEPWDNRVNIQEGAHSAYGSRYEVMGAPVVPFSNYYPLEMG